jgi:hypothetical protein
VPTLTSEHFRVFSHPDAPATEAMLSALEVDYRDLHAFLVFPEGRIDYHYLSSAEAAASCDPGAASAITGCARGRTIVTDRALDHHELIHAYLAPIGTPPPLFREGVAQGIACGPAAPSAKGPLSPWRTTVVLRAAHQSEVYDAGLMLFVYLVKTFGIERFVGYYAEARDTSDPEVFRQQYEAFWGISLDDTWRDMQLSERPQGAVSAICSCSQSPLSLDGVAVDGAALDTFVVPLPDADPGPYLFDAAASAGSARLAKCAQDSADAPIATAGGGTPAIVAARLLPERYYFGVTPGSSLSARRADFLASTCAAADPIPIPAGYQGRVDVVTVRAPDDPLQGEWFAHFTFLDSGHTLRISEPPLTSISVEMCPGCDATGTACTIVPSGGGGVTSSVPGAEFVLHLRTAGLTPGAFAPVSLVVDRP